MSFELVLSYPTIASYARSSPFKAILLRPIVQSCVRAVHAVWCAILSMLFLIFLYGENERGGFWILWLDFHGTFILLSVYVSVRKLPLLAVAGALYNIIV